MRYLGYLLFISLFLPPSVSEGAVVHYTSKAPTAGLADKAIILATPRAINGVNFDGSASIAIPAASVTSPPFNAACNNAGDDSTALQAAINANGVAAYIPKGVTCRYATGLTIGVGKNLVGEDRGTSKLSYTGAGVAITVNTGAVAGSNRLENFTLTTATGTHGVRVKNTVGTLLRGVTVTGFSTAGVELTTEAGEVVLSPVIDDCDINANGNGVIATGVNATINHANIINSRIRANTVNNIFSAQQVFGWRIVGNDLEGAGSTAVVFNLAQGLDISGNYFEQVLANLSAIQLATSLFGGDGVQGVSLRGNFFQNDAATGTAVILGPGNVFGFEASGNTFHNWTIGYNPQRVVGGRLGPDRFASVTTPVNTFGASTTGLVVQDSAGLLTDNGYGLGLLHSSAGGAFTSSLVVSADLNITTTTCTNQFMRTISATAVGGCQSIVGADLPNPSASTLGGVQSLTAVTSKWINTISTSGVPSATQPASTDLSDVATLATLTGSQALTNKTYNGLTVTSTTGTFTVAAGKTVTQNSTLTYSGTDGSSVAFGTGGIVLYSGGALGTPASGVATNFTGTAAGLTAGLATDTVSKTGTGSTYATGTAPTITNPVIINIAPGNDFTLTQNSVVPFKSENAGALVDTIHLKAGQVGIRIAAPTNNLHVVSSVTVGMQSTYPFVAGDSVDSNRGLGMGYLATPEMGFLQAFKSGLAFEPLSLNPNGGKVGIGMTTAPNEGLEMGATLNIRIPNIKSITGQRFVCVDTNGTLVSSVAACVGT